jgi:NADPH:quinone reductase-like Zn-dependent oxidoreductase
MKSIVYTKYGSPDVLQPEKTEKPVSGDNEILVKVKSISVNPADWHLMRGSPFIARFTTGLFKPKASIPGIDIAGSVETVGRNVKEFQPGDEIFGSGNWGGGCAEYACISENRAVLKPANITFEEAAAVPVAAITALQGLRYKGTIQPGQKVLINGASGGVGTYGVQVAKSFGAEVTGVCSTRNIKMVHSIGADQVIDYTKEDFTRNGQTFDFILDTIGNHSLSDYKRALHSGGKCVIIGYTSLGLLFQHMLLGPVISTKKKWAGLMGTARVNKEDLVFLKELLESGKIKSVIDKKYALENTAEAIRYLETGHARGKVIITI